MDGFRCSLEQENILQRYHAEIVELLKKATGSGHRVMGDDKGCFGRARGTPFLAPSFSRFKSSLSLKKMAYNT